MSLFNEEIDINNESELDVVEESLVFKDNHNKIYIGIYPDAGRNFEQDPYFKISWQQNFKDNNKVARISMSKPEYIIHYNRTVIVPEDILSSLNYNLSNASANNGIYTKLKDEKGEKKIMTIWEALLNEVSQISSVDIETLKKKFKNIPNYSGMSCDKSKITTIKWGE